MTEKLYLRRPYQRAFRATITSQTQTKEGWEAVLDRTAFYPTSGGQPHDTGLLDGVPVTDVIERENEIVHRLARGPVGRRVRGEIDWPRRFDHMQQHTGQHILSQAFEQVFGLRTVSFHLGREASTIDLNSPSVSTEQAAQAEDRTNQLVFEDRPVHSYFVSEEKSADLDLRRLPSRHGTLRIVEIHDFDCIPCGGTHCRRTGEVGLIKVTRLDRRGAETRVEFLCGGRALVDYRWKNEALHRAADALSAHAQELPETLAKTLSDREALRKQMEEMRALLLDHEAAALAARAEHVGSLRVVRAIFAERPPDELKWLAQRVTDATPCAVLLASRGEKGHLVFARSAGVPADASALLRLACAAVGGRGGGRPELAQGGAPPERLEEALEEAARSLAGGG